MRQLPLELLLQAPLYGNQKHYHAGETIHLRGDRKPGLSVIMEGLVKVGNAGLDGGYQLTALLKKGDTFGEFTLFASLPRTHNANAFTDCIVVQLNPSQFEQWMTDCPSLSTAMLANVSQKLHSALEMLDDTRRLSMPARLAKVVMTLASEQNTQVLSLRQSDCAEMLGVTLLSAHKALNKLTQKGLLSSHYGKIEILDATALTAFVEQESSLQELK